MDTPQAILFFLIGFFFCAGISGFCLLKIYDEFNQALRTNNRIRLWVAFSFAMLTLSIVIIGSTGIGMNINKQKFSPLRISVPVRSNTDSGK